MITNEPEMVRATGISVRLRERKPGPPPGLAQGGAVGPVRPAAMGDLDGDGLDDVVFADSEVNRLRIFFQKPDGSFVEMAEAEEPQLDSPGQCLRLADLDGDGRLDILLSKTVASYRPGEQGGWSVYLNRR